jgi:hypothetical protein
VEKVVLVVKGVTEVRAVFALTRVGVTPQGGKAVKVVQEDTVAVAVVGVVERPLESLLLEFLAL